MIEEYSLHEDAYLVREQQACIVALEAKLGQTRTLLIAIDEALCCNPKALDRVVALLADTSRNPFAELMTCAQRDLAVNVTHAEQPEDGREGE